MMGRRDREQGHLFYCFNLEDVVPEDHLVRAIAAVLDLSWVHAALAPHYSAIGRPSIDPALIIRMLIVGYVFAIRSERALCREVQVNLAYRWFCGFGIEDKIPDHSVFSRARNERFRDHNIFRQVFERVVGACITAGLVGGDGFAGGHHGGELGRPAQSRRSLPRPAWACAISAAVIGDIETSTAASASPAGHRIRHLSEGSATRRHNCLRATYAA
jgi:transposase